MNSDTIFATPLSYTTTNLDEAKQFVSEHKVEEVPLFTESVEHLYDSGSKRFQIKAEGEPLRFTNSAYLEFCGHLGIPTNFALRIPNDLLIQCVVQMLSSGNQKLRLLVRDKDVISGVKGDTFVPVNPNQFVEAAETLFDTHLFRESSISDRGTTFLFEPLADQTISPNVENIEDRFNVGIAFKLGFGNGLIQANPYSLRHCCINVAISRSEMPKYNLIEKIRRTSPSRYFDRLLEHYHLDTYQHHLHEINIRLGEVMSKRMTDYGYVRTYSPLSRLLGSEVALSLVGVTEERHEEIMAEVKYKKAKNEWTEKAQTELEDLNVYELFNQITAAGKSYSGEERIHLQEIGGELI